MDKQWKISLSFMLVFMQFFIVGLSVVARKISFPVLESVFSDFGQAFPSISIFYFSYIDPYLFILPIIFLIAFITLLRDSKQERLLPAAFASGAIVCFVSFVYGLIAYMLPLSMIAIWNFSKIFH